MSAVISTPVAWSSVVAEAPPPSMAARITLIIEAFESRTVRLLLDEIAFRTQLPRSTTHRILEQLVQLGWLEHSPDGYGIGWRSLKFCSQDNENSKIRAEAAPLLHNLQIRTGMVVHLAILDGSNVHYLDKIGGRSAISVPSQVGGSNPAHGTALGKSMLAWKEPEQVDELFKNGMQPVTRKTIGDSQALHAELNRIRRRGGVAYESGESFEGIACVAAAIRSRREPVASISLVGRSLEPVERMAPLVISAARQVSAALFPHIVQDPRVRLHRGQEAGNRLK